MTSLFATISEENKLDAGDGKHLPETHFPEQDQDQAILSDVSSSSISFKTSAFVPHSTETTLTDGSGNLHDLYETIVVVLRALSAYLHIGVGLMIMYLF
jgi:hypothetical protein